MPSSDKHYTIIRSVNEMNCKTISFGLWMTFRPISNFNVVFVQLCETLIFLMLFLNCITPTWQGELSVILKCWPSLTWSFEFGMNGLLFKMIKLIVNFQSWAIGTWDWYSGIPVLPEVKIFYRLLKYQPFDNSTGYLLTEVIPLTFGSRYFFFK